MAVAEATETKRARLQDFMKRHLAAKPDLPLDAVYKAPTMFQVENPPADPEDFLPAPDLQIIAARMLREYEEFEHLADTSIVYLWKRKGGASQGKATFGKCQKTSGMVRHFSEATWIIWLAADAVNDYQFTRRQVEALLHHELCHASEEEDEEGNKKPAVAGHDFDGFTANVRRYGAWHEDLKLCREAWEQLSLELNIEELARSALSDGSK